MSRYFFSMSDGTRLVHDRKGVELPDFVAVQREIVDFGLKVLKHKFSYGIEDPSLWSIHVSNEDGRMLTRVPLPTIKRLHRYAGQATHVRG
jgi:hypothetical protein